MSYFHHEFLPPVIIKIVGHAAGLSAIFMFAAAVFFLVEMWPSPNLVMIVFDAVCFALAGFLMNAAIKILSKQPERYSRLFPKMVYQFLGIFFCALAVSGGYMIFIVPENHSPTELVLDLIAIAAGFYLSFLCARAAFSDD